MAKQIHNKTGALIIAIAVALALFAIVAGVMWINVYRELTLQRTVSNQQRILEMTEQQVEGILREADLSLTLIDRTLGRPDDIDPRHDPLTAMTARQLYDLSEGLIALRLVDRDGWLYDLRQHHEDTGTDISDRPYFRTARAAPAGKLLIVEPVKSRVSGKWGMNLARRLQNPRQGVIIGTVLLEMEPLVAALGMSHPEPGVEVQLTNTNGTILARWPQAEGYVGRNLHATDEFRQKLAQGRGWFFTPARNDPEGARLVSFARMDEFPLIVTVARPANDVLQPIAEEMLRVELAVVLFILTESAAFGMVGLLLKRLKLREQALKHLLQQKSASVTELHQRTRELETSQCELEKLSSTDALTGLFNRRHFMEALVHHLTPDRLRDRPLSLAYLDIDLFKSVNDRYGHSVGDQVLCEFAARIQRQLRPDDLLARIGGEEFALLLPDTVLPHAASVLERIRLIIDDEPFTTDAGRLDISFSGGLTAATDLDTAESLIKRADEALYRAKSSGRDRVMVD